MIIELPQVGESVTEGVIGKWLKSVGDRVERFDPLVEVITDKVNMEMPSPVAGTLSAILAEEGATVPMGAPIAEMDSEGEQADSGAAAELRSESPPVAEPSQPADRIGTLLKGRGAGRPTGSGGPISADKPPEPRARPRTAAILSGGSQAGGGARRRTGLDTRHRNQRASDAEGRPGLHSGFGWRFRDGSALTRRASGLG